MTCLDLTLGAGGLSACRLRSPQHLKSIPVGAANPRPEASHDPPGRWSWFSSAGDVGIPLVPLVVSVLLAFTFASSAQPVITAKNYSGFMRGSGYAWRDHVPVAHLGRIQATLTNGFVVLEWPGRDMLRNLRNELLHPNTARYVRDPDSTQGWVHQPYVGYGLPFWMVFEFDAAALYSRVPGPPPGWQGHFATTIQLTDPPGGPTFYVHGYLDQIGQATAADGDPAHVFKLFGRDILDAVRREALLP